MKSTDSQEVPTLLTSLEFFVNNPHDHENEIRGLLRPFGLTVRGVAARDFEAKIRELAGVYPKLALCMFVLLRARAEMQAQLAELHGALLRVTVNDELCRRPMTIPGVGPVTAQAFKATNDDPGRFRCLSDVGVHLGLTPREYQSGATDATGRISWSGDAFTPRARFTDTLVMLTPSRQRTWISAWGLRIAKRSILKKARIAVARKLAVVMHRTWRDDAPFRWGADA